MKDEYDSEEYACDGDCLYDSVSKECDYADFLIDLAQDREYEQKENEKEKGK